MVARLCPTENLKEGITINQSILTPKEEAWLLTYLSKTPDDVFNFEKLSHSLMNGSFGVYQAITEFLIDIKWGHDFDWHVQSPFDRNDPHFEGWINPKTKTWFTNQEIKMLCLKTLHPTKLQKIINHFPNDKLIMAYLFSLLIVAILRIFKII